MAFLRIVRDSGYADRIRAYKVVVDGSTVGTIGDGETKEFLVSGGQHNVSLKIDWCGSNTIPFAVAEGDVATFDAKSNLRGGMLLAALWYITFARNSYLAIVERS